ncbi:MAG TPA: response regulator transcription factor [Chitinispirillaceae bacterium]|nr:response regulator transcription factor [Chitinispirillaceae bacterium]
MQLNILIADDHPIFLKGLREVIESDKSLKVVSVAHNGQSAVTAFQSDKRIDVVILDIDMPRMNGLEAAGAILRIRGDVPIIILTMHKDKALFLKALEIGIQGYLLKENAVVDVISAIYKVAEGNTYLSPELSIHLFKRNKPATENENLISTLTQAEKKILNLVAEYKSSKEIAALLFISEKTVFNHRMNICKKLNLTGKNSLLRYALEHTI